MSQLMTTTGLAFETRVPVQTIKNWTRRGLIDHQRDTAGRRLFDRSAIAQVVRLRDQSWHERRGIEAPETDAA